MEALLTPENIDTLGRTGVALVHGVLDYFLDYMLALASGRIA